MHYGTHQVSPADPADITDRDASDDEVDGAIEEMFDDHETFADEAGWPGETSWGPESLTMTLYTDERTVSEASDEDLLDYGISDAVEHLDYGVRERIDAR